MKDWMRAWWLGLFVSLTLVPAGGEAAGGEAPVPMLKIVFRNVSPDANPRSPAAQPHTLYRMGNRYGRMEYPPDAERGVRAIVIVSSPDYWYVDPEKGTAQHRVDPSPGSKFRAPILSPTSAPKAVAEGLEFGHEFEFFASHSPALSAVRTKKGEQFDRQEVHLGNLRLVLFAPAGTTTPRELHIYRGREVLVAYHYDEYQRDLAADPTLFQPPRGMRIIEETGKATTAQPRR